jgi:hypothetical protein
VTKVRAKAVLSILVSLIAAIALFTMLREPRPPSEIRARLDADYPGWQPARLNDFNRRQLQSSQHAAYLRGDFDGDGRADWVVQIIEPGERIRRQSVLVFLATAEGAPPHVVHTASENAGTYIGRRAGGVDRDVVEDTVVRAGSDILDILFGQEAGIAMIYRNGEFISYTTGD